MKILAYLAVALTTTSTSVTATSWNMKPVRSLQARIQGDQPLWDSTKNAYVSSFYKDFNDQYVAVMDTVNTASIEGALKYVQSECINQASLQNCQRKNNVKYVVFYDIHIANTNFSLAEYQLDTTVYPEYGPFVAMDGGTCTPTTGTTLPPECLQYNGLQGQPKLGPYVGGVPKDDDQRAPYNNTIWFSYPNGCEMQPWSNKTKSCRTQYPGGLCPFGKLPDGVTCTFSYSILGYLTLDDLVGITSMKNPKTGKLFTNYTQFCEANMTEFHATDNGVTFVDVTSDLTFWNNPTSSAANANRTQVMIDMYNTRIAQSTHALAVTTSSSTSASTSMSGSTSGSSSGGAMTSVTNNRALASASSGGSSSGSSTSSTSGSGSSSPAATTPVATQPLTPVNGVMKPLATIAELTAANPPCYENSKLCYDAQFGCRRVLYSQICEVCTAPGTGCVTKSASYKFPVLTKAPRTVTPTQERSSTNATGNSTLTANHGKQAAGGSGSDATTTHVTSSIALLLVTLNVLMYV